MDSPGGEKFRSGPPVLAAQTAVLPARWQTVRAIAVSRGSERRMFMGGLSTQEFARNSSYQPGPAELQRVGEDFQVQEMWFQLP
jgi:hypothetical protein